MIDHGQYRLVPTSGAKLRKEGAPPLLPHLHGHAPTDLFQRYAAVGSLYA